MKNLTLTNHLTMTNPAQYTGIYDDRMHQLVKMAFSDALKISEKEENYELCAKLYNALQNMENRDQLNGKWDKGAARKLPLQSTNQDFG